VALSLHPQDFLLALRNVLRQRRRAAFALLILCGGVIALVLASGFINKLLEGMRESTIRSQLGHVQIVRPGFFEKGIADPYAFLLPQDESLLERVRQLRGVRTVTPRLTLSGLLSLNDATLSFMADGIDPDREKELSKSVQIVDGEPLASSSPKEIILGLGLAANLGAHVGDMVVLLVNTPSGGVNAVEVRIRGLFLSTSKAYDDAALRLPIVTARELTRVSGASSWLVLAERTEDTDVISHRISEALGTAFHVAPWYRLADFYKKTEALFSRQVGVVRLLIGLIIILSITNTMSMAIIERTGEIGTIMAVGSRRSGILRMFLMEGFVLGVVGGGLGVVIGFALAELISALGGIPMPPPPGMTQGFSALISVTPDIALKAFMLAVATTMIASVLPAWKASRLPIVDALRHQR
jgi:putative ABC transport system permease protein